MKKWFIRHFGYVRRSQAVDLMQNFIVGFGISVIGVRLLILLSPVKQVNLGDFHVAHMLYGGIFLFAALLLVMIFYGSKILILSSWLAGLGFGLFIDEIGKFVSLNNDYYYKLAAPLIYMIFIFSVFLLLLIRKKQTLSNTEKIVQGLNALSDAISYSATEEDISQAKTALLQVKKHSKSAEYQHLATTVLELFKLNTIKITEDKESVVERFNRYLVSVTDTIINKKATVLLFYGFFILRLIWGTLSAAYIFLYFVGLSNVISIRRYLVDLGLLNQTGEFSMIVFTSLLEIIVNIGLIFAFGLFIKGKKTGYELTRKLLMFSIIVLGVFNVYFGQFSALISVIIDTILLFIVQEMWKRKYIVPTNKD